MLYMPPAFRETDTDILHGLIRASRLAILVSPAPEEPLPWISHLPLLLSPAEGSLGTLHGHVAKANPHWQALVRSGRALVIFPGPEAYVSPGHYVSKREHGKVVPTWNYVAVHVECDAEVYQEPERLHALVSRLTDHHEQPRADPWAVTDAPAPFIAGQLKGIVGLALRITALVGKRKLSQNRSPEDRAGVISGLASSEDARDRDVAAVME